MSIKWKIGTLSFFILILITILIMGPVYMEREESNQLIFDGFDLSYEEEASASNNINSNDRKSVGVRHQERNKQAYIARLKYLELIKSDIENEQVNIDSEDELSSIIDEELDQQPSNEMEEEPLDNTPTPQPTVAPTTEPTSTPSQTPTADPMPTPTASPSPSPESTNSPSPTPTPTPTPSPSPTPELSPTPDPTPTASPSPSPDPEPTEPPLDDD